MTSIAGLKMPLSGMVEKTTIIQSGNSQTSASGTSTACSAIERAEPDGGLRPHARSLPSQRFRSEIETASAAIV